MKKSSYMTRALQAKDPRFAAILGKLGYERADLRSSSVPVAAKDDLSAARSEYHQVIGKRAYHAWTLDELREKIAAAKAQG